MKSVLIVEDSEAIAVIVKHSIEAAGFTATIAGTAEEALASAQANPPALVVLDVRLPTQDGWDVAKALRAHERTATVPILMLTVVRDAERGMKVGANDYMTKPFEVRDLEERVRRLLE